MEVGKWDVVFGTQCDDTLLILYCALCYCWLAGESHALVAG